MAIISAAIEDNGWVLAVRGDWGASDFAAFALDPDGESGAPKVALTVLSAGFDRIGGQAVANPARTRTLVATKPLRKPYPDDALIDELDHGDGTKTVRLALSNRVYAGDDVSCVFDSQWRAGQPGATRTVVNNSIRVPPLPIVRIAVPHMQMVDGPGVRLDLIIASHHPEHSGSQLHQAVAAVKFTATDDVRTNEVWVTAPSTSTVYGDTLRCWGLDPVESGLFAGLGHGNVTVHWTVYPWIGAARTSGSGRLTGIVEAVYGYDAEVPFVCAHDPGRTLYPPRYVVVDGENGTTTPANVTIAGSLADAKAGTMARTITVAMQALYLQNITVPPSNGAGAQSRSLAWTNIVLKAGVQTFGTTAVSAIGGLGVGRVVISGDPDDADPRANVILRTMASAPGNNRNALYWLENMTVEMGEAALLTGGGSSTVHFHNCEMRGKPGFEGATNTLFTGSGPAGRFLVTATQSRWWRYGGGLYGSNQRAGLLRNFESGMVASGLVHVTSRKIRNSPAVSNSGVGFDLWAPAADCMVWQCEAYENNGYLISPPRTGGSWTAEDPAYTLRLAIVDTIVERSGPSTGRFFTFGETADSEARDCLFEGVTTVGNGINIHNDGSLSSNLSHAGTTFRNCWIERNGTKHDIFARNGVKTAAWEILYGVGYEGNVNNNRIWTDSSNFQYEFYGLRGRLNRNWSDTWGSNNYPKFVEDLSVAGPLGANPPEETIGGGDYRPGPGSPARDIGGASSVDTWADGVTFKGLAPAAGALMAFGDAPLELFTDSATHVVTDTGVLVAGVAVPTVTVMPHGSQLVMVGGEAAVQMVSGAGTGDDICGFGVRVLRVRPD